MLRGKVRYPEKGSELTVFPVFYNTDNWAENVDEKMVL